MRISTLLGTALLLLPFTTGQAQSDDSKVRIIHHDRVDAAFAKGMALIEVADYKIHASRREADGMAEIHTRDTDIAYVLEGSATLVTGGSMVGTKPTGPEELRGRGITGGASRQVRVGDVIIIPNGVPHWFKDVQAPFRYYVVKVRQASREMAGVTR